MSRDDLSRLARDEHMERERRRDELQRGARFDMRKHLKRKRRNGGRPRPPRGNR